MKRSSTKQKDFHTQYRQQQLTTSWSRKYESLHRHEGPEIESWSRSTYYWYL